MRNPRHTDVIAGGIVAVGLLAGLLAWPALPDRLAVHWAGSTPDTFVAKPLAVLGIPLVGLAGIALVRLLPDWAANTPGGEGPAVLFLGVVFAYVEGVVVVWNLGYRFDVTLAVLPVLLLAVGLVAVDMGLLSR